MLYQQRFDDFNEFEVLSGRLKLETKRHGPGDPSSPNPASFSTAKIQQKLFTVWSCLSVEGYSFMSLIEKLRRG